MKCRLEKIQVMVIPLPVPFAKYEAVDFTGLSTKRKNNAGISSIYYLDMVDKHSPIDVIPNHIITLG